MLYIFTALILLPTVYTWGTGRILALKKAVGASVVSVGILSTVSVTGIVHADDLSDMSSPTSSNIISVTTSTVPVSTSGGLDDDARVQRKLAKQRELSGGSDSDGSYLSSFKKEQAKQKAQKRSKAQKARDLCESLGRGC